MGNRLYTAAVIVCWLATMGWLFTDRVLPSLTGERGPSARLMNQVEPVAWAIQMDGKPCGVAVLRSLDGAGGSKEVHSFLRVDYLESPNKLPLWMRPFANSLSGMSFDMRTVLMFDPLGELRRFKTWLLSEDLGVPIRVSGSIRDDQLQVRLNVADIDKRFQHHWPRNATYGGQLSPTVNIHRLYEGRRWTSEVYSPFAAPSTPVEMIEAVVTERLKFVHDDEHVDVWEVEQRSMKKTGSAGERVLTRLLVGMDGRVLQQETEVFGSQLVFVRAGAAESARLADELLELDRYATIIPTAAQSAEADPALNNERAGGLPEPRAPGGVDD